MRRTEAEYTHRVGITVGTVTLVAVAILLFWQAFDAFLVVFGAVLFALFISGASRWLGRWIELPYRASLFIILALLVGLLAGFFWLAAPQVATQAEQLTREIPSAFADFSNRLAQYQWGRWLLDQVPPSDQILRGVFSRISATTIFSSTLGVAAAILVIAFLGLYLAIDPEEYRRGAVRLFPPRQRDDVNEILDVLGRDLERWLIARAISMAVIAVMTSIGLAVIGIPLALVLGIIAGLLSFVPYLGPIASFVPAGLVSLQEGGTTFLYVATLYLVVQLIESYMVTPLIERRAVRLPPGLIITAQLLLGVLLGIPGVILATPALVTIVAIIKSVYIEDVLHERAA